MTNTQPDLPPSAAYHAEAARQRVAIVAARGLARFAQVFGAVVLLVASLYTSMHSSGLGPPWFIFGGLIFAGGSLGAWLRRRGHARAAATVMLVLLSGAVAWNSWAIGLGIHSAGLAGLCLLIALAGLLVGLRAAGLLFLLYVAFVAGLGWAEITGAFDGRAVVMATPIPSRLVALALVGIAGIVAAYVFNRLIASAMSEAIGEQARLADLLRIGSDWTWEMDQRGRLIYLSPSFESVTGHPPAEFMRIGEPGGPQVIDDADWALLRDDIRQRRAYRGREVAFRCVDGSLLVVSGNGEPMHGVDGVFKGWRGVSRNITAERLAEAERRRNDQLLDRLVRTSPDPICVARLDGGRILMANPAFRRSAGTDDVVGRSAVDLGLWPDPGEMVRLAASLQRGDGVARDMRTVVQLKGQATQVMLLTAATFDWDGDPVAVISARDVTDGERARLEADAILDNAGIGIALVRHQRFERVNPIMETMFGREPGTLKGQSIEVMFRSKALFDDFAANARGLLATRGLVDVEREAMLPDGRTILVRLRGRALMGPGPDEGDTIWVAEDITERRRAERELAQAKKDADAASEAKSSFLATMSHEIRTPLNGIQGLARLLQNPSLDRDRRDAYLGHLKTAADHLGGIVSDVLDLSKIEAGQLRIEDMAFDLHELVSSVFRTFEPLGHERGLGMRCEIAPEVPQHVRGDPTRVRQILANYLSNALKFTESGRIDLRVDHADGAPGLVRLAVRDTGAGVAPDIVPQLFKPFVQADSATTRRVGGTGLGLSICRQLALRMGGQVGVDSPSDGGSVFWVDLPLPPDHGVVPELPAAVPGARPLAGMKVLVAEDNAVNMMIVCEMLAALGAEVLPAEDGAEAIELAIGPQGAGLQAVLMDLHMPKVDGLTAARRLRIHPITAFLPLIAMSAAVLEHDRRAAEQAGMRGFIAKPVTEADLLRQLLAARAGAR